MKAMIFDMDGVLIDSERHWQIALFEQFRKWIPGWKESNREKTIGLKVQDTYEVCRTNFGLKISFEEFPAAYNQIAEGIYGKKAGLMDGIWELLTALKEKNIPAALASSSRENWIESAITRLKIKPYFNAVVSAWGINGKGKPAPDIFLYAAEKINTPPENCVVIEDARNGVLAAKAAGMYCIGFKNGISGHQDLSKADMIIENTKTSIPEILSLF